MTRELQPRIRALVVGVGYMGSIHLRALGQIPRVDVAGIVDPDPARLAAAAEAHRLDATFGTLEDALDRLGQSVDFVCVATPAATLPTVAMKALEAGLPVMVEKPLAAEEDEALALVLEAERRGLLLGVGHVERCNPAVIALKARLDEGIVGRIYQLHARRLSPFPDRDSMLGVSLDLATHDIDVMRYLTGADVERVFSEAAQRLHDRAEDLIAATMRFNDGTTGLLEVNWLTPTKVRELTVTGEGGTFALNYLTQELAYFAHPAAPTEWDALASMRGAGEGDMIRYALQRREPLRVLWENYLDALIGDAAPLVTGRDAYAALSTARAIQRSGESHETEVPGYRATLAT